MKVFFHKREIIAMTNPIIQTDIADILNRLDRKLDSLNAISVLKLQADWLRAYR